MAQGAASGGISQPLAIYTDRTSITTDQACGMARWWYKEEGGNGIVPAKAPAYFARGQEFHEDFADIADGVGVESIVQRALATLPAEFNQDTWEHTYLRAGMSAAMAVFIEPETQRDYDTIKVEGELILDRDPLWIACTPDRNLIRKSDGRDIYREYKSLKRVSRGWVEHWPKAIQVHIGLMAWAEEHNHPPGIGQVMGITKGEWRDGRLRHPYVWAFKTKTGAITPEYAYGRDPIPVWEFAPTPGELIAWVETCGPEVARGLFPFAEPVGLDARLVEWTVQARLKREAEVKAEKESCRVDLGWRAAVFEPRMERCVPVVGAPCVYAAACHNREVNLDPLGSGLYVERTPHHEIETMVEGW